jgi:hypothetical protein
LTLNKRGAPLLVILIKRVHSRETKQEPNKPKKRGSRKKKGNEADEVQNAD